VLLIFSLILSVGFLVAFFWAHHSGQFEDTETPALRMLFDDCDRKRAACDSHLSQHKKTGGA
jgi:cbb3-type cytochrome oxidase maturation protein